MFLFSAPHKDAELDAKVEQLRSMGFDEVMSETLKEKYTQFHVTVQMKY